MCVCVRARVRAMCTTYVKPIVDTNDKFNTFRYVEKKREKLKSITGYVIFCYDFVNCKYMLMSDKGTHRINAG